MKNYKVRILLAVSIAMFLSSCGGANSPSEEEMKERQVSYEKKKKEINASLGGFYLSKKDELFNKLRAFEFALDTVNQEGEVNTDSNFVYANTITELRLNKHLKRTELTKGSEGYVKIRKEEGEYINIPGVVESLRVCKESRSDTPCLRIPDRSIEDFMKIDLVFIEDIVLKMEPKYQSSKGENDFESGFRVARTTCFNLNKKSCVFSFITTATNSKNVSIRQGLEDFELKGDLAKNFNKAFKLSLHKHFDVLD